MKTSLTILLLASIANTISANDNKKTMKVREKKAPKKKLLKLCQVDCDVDSDCAPGLWCADAHKAELKAKGFDERKANCGKWNKKEKYNEVCFDPKILKPSGGGGGDPHFRTYDGTKYTYHGQCDLVMARSATFGAGLGLDVHARTEIVEGWSLISNAAVRIGKDIFEVDNNGSYYFNGAKDVPLPIKMAQKYDVHRISGTTENATEIFFNIEFGDEERVIMSAFKGMISVRVDAVLDDTEGMLGRQGVAGMVGRDRETIIHDANEMGSQWQVTSVEPMLFHETRAPQYPEQCQLPTFTSRRLKNRTEEEMNKAASACSGVSEEMRQFCIDDVLLTGDYELGQSSGYAF